MTQDNENVMQDEDTEGQTGRFKFARPEENPAEEDTEGQGFKYRSKPEDEDDTEGQALKR